MAAKRGHKKGAKKRATKKHAKKGAKRRGAHIPLRVLEKRLKSLNAKVKSRGGKHY